MLCHLSDQNGNEIRVAHDVVMCYIICSNQNYMRRKTKLLHILHIIQ